jgi:hypothetical protein
LHADVGVEAARLNLIYVTASLQVERRRQISIYLLLMTPGMKLSKMEEMGAQRWELRIGSKNPRQPVSRT